MRLGPSNSIVPEEVSVRWVVVGVEVCDEKVRVRPVSLGGGEDTSRVRVENLVPLGLDDEDV